MSQHLSPLAPTICSEMSEVLLISLSSNDLVLASSILFLSCLHLLPKDLWIIFSLFEQRQWASVGFALLLPFLFFASPMLFF
ncbi:hypothetical protein B0H10DRAFT_1187629 [Mycena sp. CBHHK59/15]|nr:hypothetical protein B0H10DRAFT_1187629 [Mycena sp. CBHHK59/15]